MAGLLEDLERQARSTPSHVALRGPDEVLSYSRMMADVHALAQQLRALGVRRAGLCGDNSVAWVLADLACLAAGVVCVPVPVFFSHSQRQHLIGRAGLDALLSGDFLDGARPLGSGVMLKHLPVSDGVARMPDTTAKITFTSGSTGTPKGVCLSGAQLSATVRALRDRLSGVTLETHLCVLPLATLLENIAGIYLPLLMGATVHLAPLQSLGMTGSSGLDMAQLVTALRMHRPHSLILVPELAAALVRAAADGQLSGVGFRFVAVGGGRVAPELLEQGRAAGLPLYEGYGLSECGSVVALNVPEADRPGTVGKPLSHVSVQVDKQGHIRVSGNTHLGYLGDGIQPEARLDTGDLGGLDAEGFLSVRGRAKNLLITSFGRNISPEWLESELVQCVGARQVFVFGDGQPQPAALLVAPELTGQSLEKALRGLNACLPDYARLSRVYLRPQLLSRARGHLTDNGLPIRRQIEADLDVLLADIPFVELTATPWRLEAELTAGDDPMTFFDRLQTETAQARLHVTNAPVIRAIGEGRFDLSGYTWFLTQAYHHVKHTVPLMMACGGRLPERLEFVRKALVEYIEEEYGHHEWILDDLEACGSDREAIRSGQPDRSIELMVAYLYDRIERGNPVAFFGMVQVLEGTSIELATPLGKAIQQQLELPDEAFSYLYSHGALDQEHFEFFRTLMNDITDPEDQQAIIDAACMVYRLYGDMLHSIPLPDAHPEASHEAA